MIQAKGPSKKYGRPVAVGELSFEVSEGLVTGFVGPNGAGESTAKRLMLGLDHGAGITTFNGKRCADLSSPSRAVGASLESKAFFPSPAHRSRLPEHACRSRWHLAHACR